MLPPAREERPSGETYASILVPVSAGSAEWMMATAGRLAASRNAIIEAITVLELPMDLPLDAPQPEAEAEALELLERMRAVAERFGARVITYIVRGRSAGQAIVEEAARAGADAVVMAASPRIRMGGDPLGGTVAHVIRHTPCRLVLSIDPGVTP